jgi:transaldolase
MRPSTAQCHDQSSRNPSRIRCDGSIGAQGIAVNATLIFSVDQALECAKAFDRASQHASVDTVISVFVSRIDRAIDDRLSEREWKRGKRGYSMRPIFITA